MKFTPKQLIIIAFRGLMASVFMFAMIFAIAGTINYWQGWVFGILMSLTAFVQGVLYADNPSLGKERHKLGKGSKWWDVILVSVFSLLLIGSMVLGILDIGRFGWTESLPIWVVIVGLVLMTLGVIWTFWSMWTNNWFSTVVRIQEDREHKVCKDGPYKYTRHPGYVGVVLMAFGLPLSLGSVWAIVPGIASAIVIIIRTAIEDETLQKELPGYKEYTKETRYRLIPGIW